MGLEPVETQHVKLRRRFFGYDRGSVDQLLEDITSSFEEVWLERDSMRTKVADLETGGARKAEDERVIGDVLLTARRLADKIVAEARETAATIVSEAREQADEIVREVDRAPERLRDEISRLETIEHALRERYQAFLSGARRLLEEDLSDGSATISAPSASTPSGDQEPAGRAS